MEVKPGYKQTEVGVIPEEWEQVSLNNTCTLHNGRAYALHEWEPTGVPVIRLQNLTGGDTYYFSTLKLPENKYCERGDLLYMWSATFGPHLWKGERAIYHYHIWKVVPHDRRTTRDFLYYKLRAITEEKKSRASNGGTMLHVTKRSMEATQLALPSVPEQRAIAEALSDVDALLGGLDRLIAKKRDLKQAAMQQLLTPRPGSEQAAQTRLPGFKGVWRELTLGQLGQFLKGSGVTKDQTRSGNLACVRYGELYTHHNDVIRDFHSWISPEVASTAVRLRKGDILFAGSGETKEEIGKCAAFVADIEAYAGGDIVILRPREADPVFLGYYLNTGLVNRQKASRGQGDAVVHISGSALAAIRCRIPERAEQTAIAEVLADMDAELAALEQRRAKTRALKQAMMQELLTGRIRLV